MICLIFLLAIPQLPVIILCSLTNFTQRERCFWLMFVGSGRKSRDITGLRSFAPYFLYRGAALGSPFLLSGIRRARASVNLLFFCVL